MRAKTDAAVLTLAEARAVMLRCQGFPPPARPSLTAVLERTGFVRTLGGVEAYLALRARMPSLTREGLDAAVMAREAAIVPAVRGCMYLVPASEIGASLAIADRLTRDRSEREAAKAGIRPGEVETLARKAFELLEAKGPLTTDALRRALPAGAVRSLGEAGKKVGVSSPLPQALRRLEFAGKIERVTETGRLDTERYLWRVTAARKSSAPKRPEDSEVWPHFAEIFFRAAGISTIDAFAEWAGIGKREAAAATDKLELRPARIEGVDGEFRLWSDLPARAADPAGVADAVALLPFDDNLEALHDGPRLLVDEAHHGLTVPQWGGKDTTLGASRHMAFRSVVADGKISGFWEYDPDERTVRTAWFAKPKPAVRKRVEEVAASVTRFLADDLGHGRSFSLDTDEELRTRIRRIRTLKLLS